MTTTKKVSAKITKDDLVKKNEELQKQLIQIQEQFTAFMQMQSGNKVQSDEIKVTERANVICYFMGRNAFVLNGRDIIFNRLGERISISLQEANDLVSKEEYRKQLSTGLVVFDNDKWYDHFGISKPQAISDKYLISVLKGANPLDILNDLTENKNYDIMIHELMYRISQLIKTHRVKLEFDVMTDLEKFFKAKFDTLVKMVEYKD